MRKWLAGQNSGVTQDRLYLLQKDGFLVELHLLFDFLEFDCVGRKKLLLSHPSELDYVEALIGNRIRVRPHANEFDVGSVAQRLTGELLQKRNMVRIGEHSAGIVA